MRHAGNHAEQEEHAGGHTQHPGGQEHLLHHLAAEVLALAHPRDHHGGGHRDQQRGNLRHQRIAHRQQDVAVGRLAGGQAVLHHADDQATDDVDDQDQDAGNGVAAHELGGTVHGAEELGFLAHLGAAALGLLLVDQAGTQIGVDGHLLAGHGVQGEAGRHLGDALRALGDHHEVDDHQDDENHKADREVAADQEVAEGLDHRTGSTRAGVAFQQHHPGGRHVERQPQQRGEQQHRGEDREVQRTLHVGGHHHHDQGQRDVEREEGVQQPGRQGQHHHGKDGDHQHGGGQATGPAGVAAEPLLQGLKSVHAAIVKILRVGDRRKSRRKTARSPGTGGGPES